MAVFHEECPILLYRLDRMIHCWTVYMVEIVIRGRRLTTTVKQQMGLRACESVDVCLGWHYSRVSMSMCRLGRYRSKTASGEESE